MICTSAVNCAELQVQRPRMIFVFVFFLLSLFPRCTFIFPLPALCYQLSTGATAAAVAVITRTPATAHSRRTTDAAAARVRRSPCIYLRRFFINLQYRASSPHATLVTGSNRLHRRRGPVVRVQINTHYSYDIRNYYCRSRWAISFFSFCSSLRRAEELEKKRP